MSTTYFLYETYKLHLYRSTLKYPLVHFIFKVYYLEIFSMLGNHHHYRDRQKVVIVVEEFFFISSFLMNDMAMVC